MQPDAYVRLRKELAGEGAFAVSDALGALTLGGELLIFGVGTALLLRCARSSWAYWLLELLLATSLFRFSAIMHECAHNTLFRARILDQVAGYVCSPFCLIPYHPYRQIHEEHHRWVGVIDRDPTQRGLLALRRFSRVQGLVFRAVWKLWLPLPFAAFVFNTYWRYPARKLRAERTADGWRGLAAVAVALGPHAWAVARLGAGTYAALALPMLALYFLQLENTYVPQHSKLFRFLSRDHPQPVPIYEQDEVTRSSRVPAALAIPLGLNHNLHVEHHLFPTMPWYRLTLVERKLRVLGYPRNETGWLRFMRAARREDPVASYLRSFPPAAQTPSESAGSTQ
jgi:fatty acid desaturase